GGVAELLSAWQRRERSRPCAVFEGRASARRRGRTLHALDRHHSIRLHGAAEGSARAPLESARLQDRRAHLRARGARAAGVRQERMKALCLMSRLASDGIPAGGRILALAACTLLLTTRRTYQFAYSASAQRPDPALGDVIYALRFTYPPSAADRAADAVERRLTSASGERPRNLAYAYRGSPQLKPVSAFDDGVQTRLAFDARGELPAIFVRNDDGSESLVNFTVDRGELVVHRVARQFTVRRGGLKGCIVNQDFSGEGERLGSG